MVPDHPQPGWRGPAGAAAQDQQRARLILQPLDLMRQRRLRIKLAIKLEEIVTGQKLDAEARAAFGAAILADWVKQRELELAKYPAADWKERNEIVGRFWETIDRRLEDEYNKAVSVLETPNHRVLRKVQVRKPVGILGEKLTNALDKRKP
jgi:hypothetical protein